MKAEDKCNRCEQFGPNGLTDFPCKKIPTRTCPWFIKISDKRYKKILAERIDRINKNEELRKELSSDEDIVKSVSENSKNVMLSNEPGSIGFEISK